MICLLHFAGPGAKYPSCGSASALPPPSLGVSSLDLGRWRASGLFLIQHARSGDRAPKALRGTHSGCRRLAIELCAMRWHLLRRGNTFVAVARCGRFLPRLGSLAVLVTLFLNQDLLCPSDPRGLFRSRSIGMQFLQGDLVEPVRDRLQVLRNSRE